MNDQIRRQRRRRARYGREGPGARIIAGLGAQSLHPAARIADHHDAPGGGAGQGHVHGAEPDVSGADKVRATQGREVFVRAHTHRKGDRLVIDHGGRAARRIRCGAHLRSQRAVLDPGHGLASWALVGGVGRGAPAQKRDRGGGEAGRAQVSLHAPSGPRALRPRLL